MLKQCFWPCQQPTSSLLYVVIMNTYMGYLRALTCNLQAEAKDVIEVVDELNTVQRALHSVRDEVDSHHNEWFKDRCLKVGTQPRVCGRKQHRLTPHSFNWVKLWMKLWQEARYTPFLN